MYGHNSSWFFSFHLFWKSKVANGKELQVSKQKKIVLIPRCSVSNWNWNLNFLRLKLKTEYNVNIFRCNGLKSFHFSYLPSILLWGLYFYDLKSHNTSTIYNLAFSKWNFKIFFSRSSVFRVHTWILPMTSMSGFWQSLYDVNYANDTSGV